MDTINENSTKEEVIAYLEKRIVEEVVKEYKDREKEAYAQMLYWTHYKTEMNDDILSQILDKNKYFANK